VSEILSSAINASSRPSIRQSVRRPSSAQFLRVRLIARQVIDVGGIGQRRAHLQKRLKASSARPCDILMSLSYVRYVIFISDAANLPVTDEGRSDPSALTAVPL